MEVLAEDSIHAKTSSLDIDAHLKLSFLGGLVKVGGAAKFLDDKRTSGRQARVTLRHTSTSRFEHLSMEQLANIQHPQVLDTTQATHVVSGITYGADAFFVFDRSIEESEEMRKVHGDMEAKIKFIHVGGSASLNIKENEKSETESFKCKFFGDVELPLYPSTFKEAVEVYRDLPRLLKEQGSGVPKRVYLQPLSELLGKADVEVCSISDDLTARDPRRHSSSTMWAGGRRREGRRRSR